MNQLKLFEEKMINNLRERLADEKSDNGYTALSLIEEQGGRLYVDEKGALAKVEVNSNSGTHWHLVITLQENWLLQTFFGNAIYQSVVKEKQCSVGELYKVLAEMLVCLSK